MVLPESRVLTVRNVPPYGPEPEQPPRDQFIQRRHGQIFVRTTPSPSDSLSVPRTRQRSQSVDGRGEGSRDESLEMSSWSQDDMSIGHIAPFGGPLPQIILTRTNSLTREETPPQQPLAHLFLNPNYSTWSLMHYRDMEEGYYPAGVEGGRRPIYTPPLIARCGGHMRVVVQDFTPPPPPSNGLAKRAVKAVKKGHEAIKKGLLDSFKGEKNVRKSKSTGSLKEAFSATCTKLGFNISQGKVNDTDSLAPLLTDAERQSNAQFGSMAPEDPTSPNTSSKRSIWSHSLMRPFSNPRTPSRPGTPLVASPLHASYAPMHVSTSCAAIIPTQHVAASAPPAPATPAAPAAPVAPVEPITPVSLVTPVAPPSAQVDSHNGPGDFTASSIHSVPERSDSEWHQEEMQRMYEIMAEQTDIIRAYKEKYNPANMVSRETQTKITQAHGHLPPRNFTTLEEIFREDRRIAREAAEKAEREKAAAAAPQERRRRTRVESEIANPRRPHEVRPLNIRKLPAGQAQVQERVPFTPLEWTIHQARRDKGQGQANDDEWEDIDWTRDQKGLVEDIMGMLGDESGKPAPSYGSNSKHRGPRY